MKIGKLEKYFLVGAEDCTKMGLSAIWNATITGFDIGRHMIRNAPNVIRECYHISPLYGLRRGIVDFLGHGYNSILNGIARTARR